MSIVRVANYSTTNPYRGVVSCGIDSWPTHQAGLPPQSIRHLCSEVRFGPTGPRYRECDLVVNLPPGQSVDVDLDLLEAFVPPVLSLTPDDISALGRPLVEVVASDGYVLHRLPLEPSGGIGAGSKVRAHYTLRAGPAFLDLWVDLDPRDHFGRWKAMVTCANPEIAAPGFISNATYRLVWSSESVNVLKAGSKAAILLRAGQQMAQGQVLCSYGAVRWNAGDVPSFAAAVESAVWAKQLDLRSPIGLATPARAAGFNSLGFANRFFASTLDVLDGWGTDWEIGWLPASGSTGAVEDMGYAKGGDGNEPGTLAARYHTALRWGARPCHWLEPNGGLLERANHPALALYSGQPYLANPFTDRLGLSRMPTSLDTNGWTGPDPSHSAANNLWYASAATACPMLQRLVEHRATYLLFSETLNPAWATTSPGESRALMWSCLTFANCIRLLRDPLLRSRLLSHLMQKIEQVYLPWYENQGGVLYRYGWDPRAGISQSYTQWMSCWQQSGGAFGLYTLSLMPEVVAQNPTLASRLRSVAVQAARLVVDRCITDNVSDSQTTPNPLPTDEAPFGYMPPAGDATESFTIWDTIGLVNGLPEADSTQMREGVAVHYSGFFREAWVPLATWIAAQEGDRRAIQLHQQITAGALANPRAELCWIPTP